MPTTPPPAHILNAATSLWSQAGQAHWVPVHGQSMLPLLQAGDDVWVAPKPPKLRRGDVVVLSTAAGLLVHRLLRAEPWSQPRRLWTQGDNNRLPDPPASADILLGRVLTIRRRGATLALDTPRWRASGWLLASGMLALNTFTARSRAWGTPGRLAAGLGWRLLRLYCLAVCRGPT